MDTSDSVKELLKSISNLLSSEMFADVTMVVEGYQVKAHKNILASRNEVLCAMLTNNMTESNKNVIEIPDVDIVTFKVFLKYLYTGIVENDDLTLELLIMADKYLDEALKCICEKYLCLDINFDNAIDKLLVAHRHACHDLNMRSAKYIANHVDKFMENPKFEEILACKDVVKSILRESKFLITDSQKTIFVINTNIRSIFRVPQSNSEEIDLLIKDVKWSISIGRVISNGSEMVSLLIRLITFNKSIKVNLGVKILSNDIRIDDIRVNKDNYVFKDEKTVVVPLFQYAYLNHVSYESYYCPNYMMKLEISLQILSD